MISKMTKLKKLILAPTQPKTDKLQQILLRNLLYSGPYLKLCGDLLISLLQDITLTARNETLVYQDGLIRSLFNMGLEVSKGQNKNRENKMEHKVKLIINAIKIVEKTPARQMLLKKSQKYAGQSQSYQERGLDVEFGNNGQAQVKTHLKIP